MPQAGRLPPQGVEHGGPDRQEPEHQVPQAPARRALHQHDPHSRHRCNPGRELGAPRDAHGDGPGGYYLWQYLLRFDPQDPIWPNRDRFVLSAGHASMLLYALLHLTGVRAVSKDYERLGEPSVPLEANQDVSAVA